MSTVKGTFQCLAKKIFENDANETYLCQQKDLEKRAQETLANTYLEKDPTTREWASQFLPTSHGVSQYLHNLFPSAAWIVRYNRRWLMGDAIAGLTIGVVVVPQAMAYALLAGLSPEYGLYTSFTGAVLYWLFGTSKDIVVGTTAVGSLLVGTVVARVEEQRPGVYTHEETAKALSVMAGSILLALGLLRLGWIIEFIPYVPISAFVTAASITIISTQLPVALGIKDINTREAPYRVLINTFKGLDRTKLDAAIGITSLLMLFFIKYVCSKLETRNPSRKRLWALLSSLRLTFTMLLFTFISWLVHRNVPRGESKFRIVGVIQSGFKHAGVPRLDPALLGLILPQLPAIVIILIIEHIAIAKSFGRVFNYTIITSQEMCAQGGANLFSPFVGGYVCTGSFGASAVLSKAGVRTPLAGLFSAFVLVLALYALTSVFYYIPNAALAGLIIHAVLNLPTPPRTLYKYWQLSPFELIIWIVGVALALFTSLEVSIYCTIALSFVLVLIRLARSKGRLLGHVHTFRLIPDDSQAIPANSNPDLDTGNTLSSQGSFLPLDRNDGSNPNIDIKSLYPGVFVYRFSEGFNYINQGQHMECLRSYILKNTRRTKADDGINPTDRLWSDPGLLPEDEHGNLPVLRAVVLDCSAVNHIDITSVQGLVDLRSALDRYAAPAQIEWHFASVFNRWTRRALVVSGFGIPTADIPNDISSWCPVYTVASRVSVSIKNDEESCREQDFANPTEHSSSMSVVAEKELAFHTKSSDLVTPEGKCLEPVYGIDRPFFHVDLKAAVYMAILNAKLKSESYSE